MEMQRLIAEHIKLDQPLPWDVYDASGHLLLRKDYIVDRNDQIDNLLARGMFVSANDFKRTQDTNGNGTDNKRFNPFLLWDDIHTKTQRLLRNVKQEEEFADKILGLASLIEQLCEKDADAGISVMIRADASKYVTAHLLSVSIVAELVAKRLEWSVTERQTLLAAALTMNIAMLDLQARLVGQREPLTIQQREEIERHPIDGHQILIEAGVKDSQWLQAVLEHHESPGGKGYPKKLQQVCKMGELLHVADVFCAKVSPRMYRKAIPPNQAARDLFVSEGQATKNPSPIPAIIIKEIGIYPPGCFVKLTNGETAIVVRRGESANTPIVFSLSSGKGVPYVDPVRRDTSRKDYGITGLVPREKIMTRIDASKIWGY